MHTYIYIGDEIYTLDTPEECTLATAHMREAGYTHLPVFRGGPESEIATDLDYCSNGEFYQAGTLG